MVKWSESRHYKWEPFILLTVDLSMNIISCISSIFVVNTNKSCFRVRSLSVENLSGLEISWHFKTELEKKKKKKEKSVG